MHMQVILDSLFSYLGSAPTGGGKKGEFRDWTKVNKKKTIWSKINLGLTGTYNKFHHDNDHHHPKFDKFDNTNKPERECNVCTNDTGVTPWRVCPTEFTPMNSSLTFYFKFSQKLDNKHQIFPGGDSCIKMI